MAQTYAPGYLNPSTYFGYDASGNTTAITSPITGSLTAPGAINTRLSYDAAGRPVKVTLRDGRTITMTYNAAGERASYTVVTGTTTTLYSAQYAYRDGELGQAGLDQRTLDVGEKSTFALQCTPTVQNVYSCRFRRTLDT